MKTFVLKLLELFFGGKGRYNIGQKAPISGIYRSGNEYIALTISERFPPHECKHWYLVISV